MSYYSFYDKEGELIKEIFTYTRDEAFHKMRDIKWTTYKRRKFAKSEEVADE